MSDVPITGANVVISQPAQQFGRTDVWQGLMYGKIYIGQIDKDPTDPQYQIEVWAEMEDGTLINVPQPLRTNAAGYPIYNGQLVKYVTTQGHSMAITDANDVRMAYYNNVLKYDPDQFSGSVGQADGLKVIGRCESVDQLRTISGNVDQWINVAAYAKGTRVGGGFFVWIDTLTRVDDGGVFFRVNDRGGWLRDLPDINMLNVNHFGALPDGSNDAIPAIQRMHAWSVAYAQSVGISPLYGPGVQLGEGKYAVSSMNTGAAEIPAFKIYGPTIFYGVAPRVSLVPLSTTTTTPVFTVNPRRLEVSSISWNPNGAPQPFVNNLCVRGSYTRVHAFVAQRAAGIQFQVLDSIDTLFDQCYTYECSASFLRGRWSNGNPGSWDHLTAIELANCNFSASTSVDPVIDVIRGAQCIMRNVWIDHAYCAADLSQGGWLLDTFIVENAQTPIKAQYAKIQKVNIRVEQGAGWDYNASGYTASMDSPANGGSGRIPTWVTNDYDQGDLELNVGGILHRNGLVVGWNGSHIIMNNTTSQPQWVYVGRVQMNTLGDSLKMRIIGSTGWETSTGELDRPATTSFGAGEATIMLESKVQGVETTGLRESHWFGEANCPIDQVRMVHTWSYNYIYVRMRDYCRKASVFIDSTGLTRLRAGTPFNWNAANTVMTQAEVDALANQYTVPARWSINKGIYAGNGLGMDLDDGDLLLFQNNRIQNFGNEFAPMMYNGERRYLNVRDLAVPMKYPFVTKAQLLALSPATYVAVPFLVSDARGTPYGRGTSRLCWSDGYQWTWADDLSVFTG